MFKKLSLISLSLLLTLSLGSTTAFASHKHVNKHYHVHTEKVVHIKKNRKYYMNEVDVISLQLGASSKSLNHLNKEFNKMSTKHIHKLFTKLEHSFYLINHHHYIPV